MTTAAGKPWHAKELAALGGLFCSESPSSAKPENGEGEAHNMLLLRLQTWSRDWQSSLHPRDEPEQQPSKPELLAFAVNTQVGAALQGFLVQIKLRGSRVQSPDLQGPLAARGRRQT